MKKFTLSALLILLSACATNGANNIASIGPNLYMVGAQGGFTESSGAVVKARLFNDAAEFCKNTNKIMVSENSISKDARPYEYATAEIQFRCLLPNDPRLQK